MSDPVQTPSMPKQLTATGTGAAVSSGGGALIFALVTVAILIRLSALGDTPDVTMIAVAQGSVQAVYQTVFSIGWSLVKQYLGKRGYTV